MDYWLLAPSTHYMTSTLCYDHLMGFSFTKLIKTFRQRRLESVPTPLTHTLIVPCIVYQLEYSKVYSVEYWTRVIHSRFPGLWLAKESAGGILRNIRVFGGISEPSDIPTTLNQYSEIWNTLHVQIFRQYSGKPLNIPGNPPIFLQYSTEHQYSAEI